MEEAGRIRPILALIIDAKSQNKWQLECVNRWQANNKHNRDRVEKGEWCHYMYLPRCMHSDTYEQATTAEETGKSQAKPSNTRLMNLQLTHFGTSFSAFRVATPFPLPHSQGATCCVLRTFWGVHSWKGRTYTNECECEYHRFYNLITTGRRVNPSQMKPTWPGLLQFTYSHGHKAGGKWVSFKFKWFTQILPHVSRHCMWVAVT